MQYKYASQTYVRDRLAEVGLDEVYVNYPDVNRVLKSLGNIGYLQKDTGLPTTNGRPGVNTIYTESDYVIKVKRLVRNLKTRAVIYQVLALSGVLERHLRVWNYVKLIRCRHLGFDDEIKVLRSTLTEPILTQDLDHFEKIYLTDQEYLRKRSIRQIFQFACQYSRKELIEKHKAWYSDPIYTVFFQRGAIAYNEVQVMPSK